MPTTIKTEAARVALAHHQYEQDAAETRRKMAARASALMRDPRATDGEAYRKLCANDPGLAALTLELKAHKVWRDGVIEDGCIATIEDDGRVRWTPPELIHKRNRGHA